jgi:hypothetical protein
MYVMLNIFIAVAIALGSASAAPLALRVPRSALHADTLPREVRARHARVISGWRAPYRSSDMGNPSISPVNYGADPTGVADSSPAFALALRAMLNRSTGSTMSAGIADLGGVVLDLQGGVYSLSEPFAIPPMVGNMRIIDGTLRARDGFPSRAAVLQVGASPCDTDQQRSCNENIGLSGLTVDGRHVAETAIAINATMGATLDASSAVFGFTGCGIVVSGGHEAMITETWVAAYFWSDPLKARNNATGICLLGNDHFVTNVIVFSALTGVLNAGGANLFSGVHTWNTMTSMGGVGVLNAASASRFEGCYFDFTDLRLAVAESVAVADSFFLGGAQLEFRAPAGGARVAGVTVAGSVYSMTTLPPFRVNETEGPWTSVEDLQVTGTVWGARPSPQPRGGLSRASLRFSGACARAPRALDFSDAVVFPSVAAATRSVADVACAPAGAACTVMLDEEQPDARALSFWCAGSADAVNVSFTATLDQSVDSALRRVG